MSSFIFQGNPDRFDVDAYLADAESSGKPIIWAVSQNAVRIKEGDVVYLWRASGNQTKAVSGVVAVGEVISQPKFMQYDRRYWASDADAMKRKPRVEIDVLKVMTGREVIKRDWMKADPVLRSMQILRQPQGTNYYLTPDQAERLGRLAENTGLPWSRAESLAALWLYNELFDQPISDRFDSPVAHMAVQLGRATSGVYNKLMNFRSIDPRDSRQGLSGINHIDKEVWDFYFDPELSRFHEDLLSSDYKRVWGELTEPTVGTEVLPVHEPNEAPNADIRRKRLVSLTIRKGQAAFRKRLLHVYERKCAISGVDIEAVLDAAHIDDFARTGKNNSENGLLLRADLHDLFDSGLLTIDPRSLVVNIDPALDGSYYWQFDGQKLRDRVDGNRPSEGALESKARAGV